MEFAPTAERVNQREICLQALRGSLHHFFAELQGLRKGVASRLGVAGPQAKVAEAAIRLAQLGPGNSTGGVCHRQAGPNRHRVVEQSPCRWQVSAAIAGKPEAELGAGQVALCGGIPGVGAGELLPQLNAHLAERDGGLRVTGGRVGLGERLEGGRDLLMRVGVLRVAPREETDVCSRIRYSV